MKWSFRRPTSRTSHARCTFYKWLLYNWLSLLPLAYLIMNLTWSDDHVSSCKKNWLSKRSRSSNPWFCLNIRRFSFRFSLCSFGSCRLPNLGTCLAYSCLFCLTYLFLLVSHISYSFRTICSISRNYAPPCIGISLSSLKIPNEQKKRRL